MNGTLLISCLSVWNLACGFAQNKEQLITFRFLAGLGGSAPLSVSYHCKLQVTYIGNVLLCVHSDWWRRHRRLLEGGAARTSNSNIFISATARSGNRPFMRCLVRNHFHILPINSTDHEICNPGSQRSLPGDGSSGQQALSML